MFWKKERKLNRLTREVTWLTSQVKSLRFQITLLREGDYYKDSWKAHYFESLVEIQKANKGSRRLRRRLDKQILKNKESTK